MSDYLIKALAYDEHVRIYCCTTTDIVNDIGDRFSYFPSPLDALGRSLSIVAMMGSMLKLKETVTIRIEGSGPIGKIIVDSDAHGHIRGYVDNPHCHFEYNDGRLNAKNTIGDSGIINVIKDLKMKEPFIGRTPIISGELAEDFAYYFMVSEQVPSAISLGVLVNENSVAEVSGGFIVQLLPNTPESIAIQLEEKIKMLPKMSEMLQAGLTPEDIIKNIASDASIIEKVPLAFVCGCSKERFEKGLIALGLEEITDILANEKQIDTTCHFCAKTYHFDQFELENILKICQGSKK